MAHDVGFVTNDGDASDLMRNAGAREFHRFQVTDHIALDSQTGSAVALPEPLQLSRSPGDFIREFRGAGGYRTVLFSLALAITACEGSLSGRKEGGIRAHRGAARCIDHVGRGWRRYGVLGAGSSKNHLKD